MINYEASAINSNVTLLQKMNKIEKYLLDNQLGNVFVTYQTLADDRLSDSDIQELNDRVIGKGDLLIDNDGYLYVITGFNEHTVYIDYAHRIKLGDRLDQAELDLIQQMIDNTFKALNPISISDNNSITGNEPNDYHTIAIGTNINLKSGTNPTEAIRSVFIGNDLAGIQNSGEISKNEYNVVIGIDTDVHGRLDVAIGDSSYTNGDQSVAIGYNAVVNGDGAVQIGTGSNSNDNTLKFKTTTIVDGNGNIAVKSGGTTGQVLTKQSNNDNDYTWANPSTDLSNLDPISITDDNSINGNVAEKHVIAIGNNIELSDGTNPITPENSVIIGSDITISRGLYEISTNDNNVVIGKSCEINNGQRNVIIGYQSKANRTDGGDLIGNGIAIGNGALVATNDSIAIGTNASNFVSGDDTNKKAIMIGSNTKVFHDQGVAIGSGAESKGNGSIAIGAGAKINLNSTDFAVQIGAGTNSTSGTLQFVNTTIIDSYGRLNIPNGVNGTTGQVLTKLSNSENDYAWQTPQGGGSGSGKTFDIPMLINYTADESFSSIMNTPTTIVIDDQQTQQGLNLETSDPDFTDYEDKTSIYGYTYFTTGGDSKTQIVYGVISESSTPGTYEFTGLMPLAPEITM